MMGPPGADIQEVADVPQPDTRLNELQSSTSQLLPAKLGAIPRAAHHLFAIHKAREQQLGVSITVSVTYIEIYNDTVYDLLRPHKKGSR
jgi:hypothetical protein